MLPVLGCSTEHGKHTLPPHTTPIQLAERALNSLHCTLPCEQMSFIYRPQHPLACMMGYCCRMWQQPPGLSSGVVSTYIGNGGDEEHDDGGDVNHKDTGQ